MALVVIAAIVGAVWAALLGTAYAARALGVGAMAGIAAVSIVYIVLAASTLLWLGTGRSGWLGVTGMLVPLLIASGLAVRLSPHYRR